MGYVEFYVKITFILTLSVKSFIKIICNISHTAYSCVAYDEEKKWSEDHDQG